MGRRNPYERADYFVSCADEKFAVTRKRIRQIEAKANRWGVDHLRAVSPAGRITVADFNKRLAEILVDATRKERQKAAVQALCAEAIYLNCAQQRHSQQVISLKRY
jgi:hypothetical protein